MNQPRLVVFPRGQIDSKSKERLTKAGFVWLEADAPSMVHEVTRKEQLTTTLLTGDGLVLAALEAIAETEHFPTDQRFVRALYAALKPKPDPRPQSSDNKGTVESQ